MNTRVEQKKQSQIPQADEKRFGDIFAFQSSTMGRKIAFNARNLEVAEIDDEGWRKLDLEEANREILDWLSEAPAKPNPTFDSPAHVLQMNISQICNLKCDYCAAGGDGTYSSDQYKVDLSAAYRQVTHMLERLKPGSTLRLHFIGGEPLLYPKAIKSVARYSLLAVAGQEKKVQFSTTTNGTLISPDVANMLAEFNFKVTISLDGPPEINDRVRPAKRKDMSSTAMTESGLRELNQRRDQLRGLQFNSVFGVHNTELVKTYEYLSQFNPDSILFSFASEKDDAEANQRYIEELTRVLQLAYKKGGRKEILKIEPFADMLKRLENGILRINHCGAGKTMLHMEASGDLYACNWFIDRGSERIGRAGQPDKNGVSKYSQSFIDLHDCNGCWARFLCGGGCMLFNYEKNGDKHISDLQFCERTRKTARLAIEYFTRLNAD